MKRGWMQLKSLLQDAGPLMIPFVRLATRRLGQGLVQGGVFLRRIWASRCHKPEGRKSLRLRLLAFFSVFLVAAWLVAAFFAWDEATEYIDEFFDTQQMIFAKRLATTDFGDYAGTLPGNKVAFPGVSKHALGELEDDALSFAVFTSRGELVMTDGKKGQRFVFAPDIKGFSNIRLAGKTDIWRIVWLTAADGRHVIAVGQELDYRQKMALDMLGQQIMHWLVLLPVLLLGLFFLLSRELTPLRELAGQLRTRSPEDATPLATGKIPSEVLPMAESLNGFIARINTMLTRERSFISDAAHELRTPLAGLRVQAQVASQEGISPETREEALTFLRQGIDRCTRLLEQLLALSRLEAQNETAQAPGKSVSGMMPGTVEWASLLDATLADYRAKLEAKGLGLDCHIDSLTATAQGYPALVTMMLRNLLDNALRYTPRNAQIRIRLEKNRLSIENDAPHLPKDYAVRLGERFFRPPGQEEIGSGLGLSIVKRIAEIHSFTLTVEVAEALQTRQPYATFRVTIRW